MKSIADTVEESDDVARNLIGGVGGLGGGASDKPASAQPGTRLTTTTRDLAGIAGGPV